jgi:hypothetical protein
MQADGLLFLIAGAHSLLYVWALWVTRRPIITLFHGFLATSFIAFAVRPIISAIAGGHILYPIGDVQDSYILGLTFQLAFNVAFIAGYLLFWRRPKHSTQMIVSGSVAKGYIASLLLGVVAVVVIHMLSAGAWLPTARSGTITLTVPFGKLLFPAAVIPLSTCLPLALLVWLKHTRLRLFVAGATCLSIILLTLLYQRGFIVSGLMVAAFFFEKLRGLGYRRAIELVLAALLMVALIRPLAQVISGAPWTDVIGDPLGRFRDFVLGPNFDIADVWPVALEYTRSQGLLFGQTLLAIPARFASPSFRQEIGALTAVDRLNEFYWGDQYWSTNFGFNVNLAEEGYINFGPVTVVLGCPAGLLTAVIDYLLATMRRYDVLRVYLVSGLFISGGFVGELGGTLQWVTAFLLTGVLVWVVSRLTWRRSGVVPSRPALRAIN